MAKKKVFQIGNRLTSGLEETVDVAHNYLGRLRVEVLLLDRIELDPNNPRELAINLNDMRSGIHKGDPLYERKEQEKCSLKTLADSIKSQGILNPVIVYPYGEYYRLIAGERRTLASIYAGKTDIQAKILEKKPNDLDLTLLRWAENVERTDLSLGERLKNIEQIVLAYARSNSKKLETVTATELSKLIGCVLSHASNYLFLLKSLQVDVDLNKAIKDNKIKNLEKAVLIASAKTRSKRDMLLKACLNGASLKKLRSISKASQTSENSLRQQSAKQRGRAATAINLGRTTNYNIVKLLVESVLSQNKYRCLSDAIKPDWKNYKTASEGFKKFIGLLESMETGV